MKKPIEHRQEQLPSIQTKQDNEMERLRNQVLLLRKQVFKMQKRDKPISISDYCNEWDYFDEKQLKMVKDHIHEFIEANSTFIPAEVIDTLLK